MTIIGQYVRTFAESSHALAIGMPCNADYPFMTPTVVRVTKREVTLRSTRTGDEVTVKIRRKRGGMAYEYCVVSQTSTYEQIFGKTATEWELHPFKDERTPAVDQPSRRLF